MRLTQLVVLLFFLFLLACNQEGKNSNGNETSQNVERVTPELSSVPQDKEDRESVKTSTVTPGVYFHVIAASYKNKREADQLYRQLYRKGYPSKVLYNNGRYRVSLVSFDQKEKALAELNRLRKLNKKPDLWLLKQ